MLYLVYPLAGLPGLCAVVPDGKAKNPVDAVAVSYAAPPAAETAAEVTISVLTLANVLGLTYPSVPVST